MGKSGCYLLQFKKDKYVKFGRTSVDIRQRLKQYKGYSPNGKNYKQLLIIYSDKDVQLENRIHRWLGRQYKRQGKLEIFKCRDHKKLVEDLKLYLKTDKIKPLVKRVKKEIVLE